MTGRRLDAELVRRGLARSRGQARDLIEAGAVSRDGDVLNKASHPVTPADRLAVELDPSVSRGAHKLLGALADSDICPSGRALDAGASTGGFTQVLLDYGCDPVYAVDVGHDQLAADLRHDARVRVRERLNLRRLTLDHLDAEPVDLIVADLSFISLTLVLEPMLAVLRPSGTALLLVKPQFEVGRSGLDSRGVVRSEAARLEAVQRVREAAAALSWRTSWWDRSRLPGPSGNIEYFVKLVGGQTDDRPLTRVGP